MSYTSEEDSCYGISGEQPPSKRLRVEQDNVPPHLQMTQERVNDIIEGLVELIVVDGMAFNCVSNTGYDDTFYKLLHLLSPAFAENHLPNVQDLAGKHFDSFYKNTHATVKNSIQRALQSGCCSLMLSGWDNPFDDSVVNVLLRTNGSSDATRNTFFLKSVIITMECLEAAGYVSLIETIFKEYGGMEGVCSVTCDTTSICFSIKEALIQKYPRMVGLTDQTKASDKLKTNIKKLPWMKQVILEVCGIIKAINNRSKLCDRLWSMIHSHNELLEKSKSSPDHSIEANKKKVTPEGNDENGNMSREADPADVAEDLLDVARIFTSYGRRSRQIPVGAEEVIDAFLQLLSFLREMVNKPDFGKRLFRRKERCEELQKITDNIIKLVNDREFETTVRVVLKLLVLVGTYRRNFDSDSIAISEVLTMTLELEKQLESIPITKFFTKDRKTQVLDVFKKLKDGTVGKETEVRLLQDVHYAAYLFSPHMVPDVPGRLMPRLCSHARAYAVSRNYPNVDSYVTKLVLSYLSHHAKWIESRHARKDEDSSSQHMRDAILYWNSGSCTDPELFEIAMMTLSCSPKACKEASADYYPQKLLRQCERALLSLGKVQQLLFCRWNIKMMRKMPFNKDDFLLFVRQAIRSVASIRSEQVCDKSACVFERYGDYYMKRRYDSESDSEESDCDAGQIQD